MKNDFFEQLKENTQELKDSGLYKTERILTSPQDAIICLQDGTEVINLCANNYLGLSNNNAVVASATKALTQYGYGMSSVRFICGTLDIHKKLEERISAFLGTEDTILYSSCFDANTGLFETLLTENDAIISDSLNHASVIDGIRLCKAKRYRYSNNDMQDLEQKLIEARDARYRLIATDGVFSMDGIMANLPAICALADKYDALIMCDDSHATGFVGKKGRGTQEAYNLHNKVDILTGTLGKALGGASGGYTSGPKAVIDWLRQRSRPYLFSNTLAPVIVATTLEVLDIVEKSDDLRQKLQQNSDFFRKGMQDLGFTLIPGNHPIIPVMLHDAKLAQEMAKRLLAEGVYVISFSYPVVPQGMARIRTQMSAAHSLEHLSKALKAFNKIGNELNII